MKWGRRCGIISPSRRRRFAFTSVKPDGIKYTTGALRDTSECRRKTRTERMKKKRRTMLIVTILIAILSVTAILTIGFRRAPEKALLKIMSDRVDLQVRNVHYTEVGNSGMKWEITADTARYQKKENLALFEKVKVRLIMKDGRVFLMNGDRGMLNTQSRDVEIEGNVGIVSENGDRISTDRLLYRDAGKRIETDRPVIMENRSVRISGVGMILTLDEKKVTLLSQVRANSTGK
jgi:LPS export ABC transporter protein LptC